MDKNISYLNLNYFNVYLNLTKHLKWRITLDWCAMRWELSSWLAWTSLQEHFQASWASFSM